jgi:DNA-directed RNA polymerase subunit RPC12/RpoP
MPLTTVNCPSCHKEVQVPSESESTYCSYCGSKFETKEAITLYKTDKNVIQAKASRELIDLRQKRQDELEEFFDGPGITKLYQGWQLPLTYNERIEELDPKDILSKEMRICEEIRKMLLNSCDEEGVFSPFGIRLIGNKITVTPQHEASVKQQIERINLDAQTILFLRPDFDFTSTKALMMDMIKIDKTRDLYGLFWNGLVLAYLSLHYYFIPVVKKQLPAPLGDRLAECFEYIKDMAVSRLDEDERKNLQKIKVLDLKKLALLK